MGEQAHRRHFFRRLFLPQDSAVFCFDNGTAWQNTAPRFPLNDPTQYTWSDASWHTPQYKDYNNGVIVLRIPPAT